MAEHDGCAKVPEFERLHYFFGRMLGAQDLTDEQAYFREKQKLHNRCLHGYGTVCGLEVVPAPPPVDVCGPSRDVPREGDHEEEDGAEEAGGGDDGQEERRDRDAEERGDEGEEAPHDERGVGGKKAKYRPQVIVQCGLALDDEGNELVVRLPTAVDLLAKLSDGDRRLVERGDATTVYLSVRYREVQTQPMRVASPDACGAPGTCGHGKVLETVCFDVSVEPPPDDQRCEPCCREGGDHRLLLARIDNVKRGRRLRPGDIQNGVRRMLARYVPTRVTGVSWTHGATYTQREARAVLGTDKRRGAPPGGLEIRFSRPILTETLRPGVIDLWILKGGGGEHGPIYSIDGAFVWEGLKEGEKPPRTVTSIRFRQTDEETFNEGDRIHITVRSAFVLDECCRPLDGANVGGRVPILDEYKREGLPHWKPAAAAREACASPRDYYGPWTSGTGSPGSTFESWFYITRDKSDVD